MTYCWMPFCKVTYFWILTSVCRVSFCCGLFCWMPFYLTSFCRLLFRWLSFDLGLVCQVSFWWVSFYLTSFLRVSFCRMPFYLTSFCWLVYSVSLPSVIRFCVFRLTVVAPADQRQSYEYEAAADSDISIATYVDFRLKNVSKAPILLIRILRVF